MRGCRCKLQGSVLMSMLLLLLLWLCDVGTAAVTAARACPAEICVARSSYLMSLKGVPQSCEMGRDMSSSSSSIRRLSGKVPGEEKGTRDGDVRIRHDKYVCKRKEKRICGTVFDSYVFMIFSWQVIRVRFVSRPNKICQMPSCYQLKLCPLADRKLSHPVYVK